MDDAIDQYVVVIKIINEVDAAFGKDFYNACKRKSIGVIFSENTKEAKEKLLNL